MRSRCGRRDGGERREKSGVELDDEDVGGEGDEETRERG